MLGLKLNHVSKRGHSPPSGRWRHAFDLQDLRDTYRESRISGNCRQDTYGPFLNGCHRYPGVNMSSTGFIVTKLNVRMGTNGMKISLWPDWTLLHHHRIHQSKKNAAKYQSKIIKFVQALCSLIGTQGSCIEAAKLSVKRPVTITKCFLHPNTVRAITLYLVLN